MTDELDDPYLDGMRFAWKIVKSYNEKMDPRNAKDVAEKLEEVGINNLTIVVPVARRKDQIFKAGLFDTASDYQAEMQKRRLEGFRYKGYPDWIAINGR